MIGRPDAHTPPLLTLRVRVHLCAITAVNGGDLRGIVDLGWCRSTEWIISLRAYDEPAGPAVMVVRKKEEKLTVGIPRLAS